MSEKEKELIKQVHKLEERIANYKEVLTSYTNIFTAQERLDRVVGLIERGM